MSEMKLKWVAFVDVIITILLFTICFITICLTVEWLSMHCQTWHAIPYCDDGFEMIISMNISEDQIQLYLKLIRIYIFLTSSSMVKKTVHL